MDTPSVPSKFPPKTSKFTQKISDNSSTTKIGSKTHESLQNNQNQNTKGVGDIGEIGGRNLFRITRNYPSWHPLSPAYFICHI
ncbi:9811_t:CDS:2 [Cetraspora pellucida]|uniref:9811_t:CDS:1 n=1 Tax=Cetraspora pellucida TaxID=1433469 RepID=A0ACA9MYB6_9GLOM|nr:9811_t:CDS:2 [Cetraspora pellucida]